MLIQNLKLNNLKLMAVTFILYAGYIIIKLVVMRLFESVLISKLLVYH